MREPRVFVLVGVLAASAIACEAENVGRDENAGNTESVAASPVSLANTEFVDLSHSYGADTIFWPTADPFRLDVVADGMK